MPYPTYQPYQTPDYSLAAQQAQPGMRMPQQQMQQPVPPGAMQPPIDPQLVQQMLALQQQQQQQSAIGRQMRMADMMRTDAGAQLAGRTVGGKGNEQYIAPNLANLAANVYGNYKAGRLQDDADVRAQNLGVQKTDAMRRYFEALSRGNSRGAMPYMGDEGE